MASSHGNLSPGRVSYGLVVYRRTYIRLGRYSLCRLFSPERLISGSGTSESLSTAMEHDKNAAVTLMGNHCIHCLPVTDDPESYLVDS